ncbi:MAG: hypothetical protein ACXIU7_08765 [Roseinatronobacter sp.]
MDWTQIESKWVAMTRRIRSDRDQEGGAREALQGSSPDGASWSSAATSRRSFETMADTVHELGKP